MTSRLQAFCAAGALGLLAACGSGGTSTEPAAADTTAALDASTSPDTIATPDTTTSPDTTAAPDTTAMHTHMDHATTYPLTIDNCGREVTFTKPPERVVILNGTSIAEVESFLALGIGGSVVANGQSYGVSDIDGMVEKIAALSTGGVTMNENFEIPREQTLAQNPDLVISTWAGGFSEEMGSVTRDQLDELGINSFVTPVNCAYGALEPRPEDQAAWDNQTYEASFQLIEQLGEIFDVQEKAAEVINAQKDRISSVAVAATVERPKVLVAYPGMSMMNANGLPAVFGGSFYDSLIDAAGGVNAFPGMDFAEMGNINAEQLVASNPDVLVVGLFMPGEDAATYAEQLFAAYPEWPASKTKTYTSVAESIYLGPYNSVAIEKIAAAIKTLG